MDCPNCHLELERIEVEGIELDSCPACQGIWFEEGELEASKDHADPDLAWMDFELWKHEGEFDVRAKAGECPRCRTPLFGIRYADTDVLVDHCPQCRGAWVEGGQFERIVTALEREMHSRSLGELFADTLHEAREIVTGDKSLAEEWRDFRHVLRLLKLRLLADRPGLRTLLLRAQENSPFH